MFIVEPRMALHFQKIFRFLIFSKIMSPIEIYMSIVLTSLY